MSWVNNPITPRYNWNIIFNATSPTLTPKGLIIYYCNITGLGLRRLTPLSTIFQLCSDGQFYWWRKPRGPGENHRPVASHGQTLSHSVAMNGFQTHNINGARHWLHCNIISLKGKLSLHSQTLHNLLLYSY